MWEIKTVSSLGKVVTGKTPAKEHSEYWDGTELFVSPKDMERDSVYIYITEASITSKALKKFKNQILPRNSVMYTCLSYGFGKIGIASRKLLTNQQINSIIVNADNDYRFVYYLLRVNTPFVFSYNSGIDTPIVPKSVFEKIKLLVPVLPIQKKIADILFSYDDLIENNNRRIELLEKVAQELYKEWFVRFRFPNHKQTRFVNGLPEGWEYMRLGNAIDIIDGDRGTNYPKKDDFFTEGYCVFLNTGNVTINGFDFSALNYITKAKDSALRKGKLRYNDVVLTTRGTVGNSAFYNEKIVYKNMRINSGMVIFRGLGIISPEYMYTLLKHEYLQKTMELYASGSAQPQLPIKDLSRIKIVKPNEAILKAFTDICKDIYSQISLLATSNQNLRKQRDLLLPRLMSGRLEV